MFRISSICALIGTLFFASFPLSAASPAFEQALNELVADSDMVGLAVAIVEGEHITFMETYGVRELGSKDEITPDTTFRIASLSKGFAGTLTALLVNEGKLSLNDPITFFNDDFTLADPTQAAAATLADTLSHQLSLPPYAYDNLLEAGKTPSYILRTMRKVKPVCAVGDCYAYQNVGFNMITSVIEDILDQPYTKAIEERLFNPLGMTGTSFGRDNLQHTENWARSYSRNRNGPWKTRSVKNAYYNVPAAGGVNATLFDMTQWLSAQMGNRPEILSTETLELTQIPRVKTVRELLRYKRMRHLSDAHYGLGWRLYEYAGTTVVNHSGSVEGYSAQIAFLPEKNVGIVLLTNSRTSEFWDILQLFLDAELGLENPDLVGAAYD